MTDYPALYGNAQDYARIFDSWRRRTAEISHLLSRAEEQKQKVVRDDLAEHWKGSGGSNVDGLSDFARSRLRQLDRRVATYKIVVDGVPLALEKPRREFIRKSSLAKAIELNRAAEDGHSDAESRGTIQGVPEVATIDVLSPHPVRAGSNALRADRLAEVKDFLLRCNQETPLKVVRTHIWRAAGHTTPRQFQYWQKSDPKATSADETNFRRILRMSPTDFLVLLNKKRIV